MNKMKLHTHGKVKYSLRGGLGANGNYYIGEWGEGQKQRERATTAQKEENREAEREKKEEEREEEGQLHGEIYWCSGCAQTNKILNTTVEIKPKPSHAAKGGNKTNQLCYRTTSIAWPNTI